MLTQNFERPRMPTYKHITAGVAFFVCASVNAEPTTEIVNAALKNNSIQSSQAQVPASASGICGIQTGTVVAIPFTYVTPMNVGKYITLSATSKLVTYNVHDTNDAPNINWSLRYKEYKYGDGGGAVSEWILNSIPENGTVYEKASLLVAGDRILDPDDLFYVPNGNYSGVDSFTYCAADITGQSNIATVSIQVANTNSYPMPYGIPDPGFGIDEQPPADPPEWPSAERSGYYYVDSGSGQCNDAGNDYGYPDLPRCSFPASGATIIAGGKMVLVPSTQPYSLRNNAWHQVNFAGTAANPSWLIGNDTGPLKPIVSAHPGRGDSRTEWRVTGEYIRISGLTVQRIRLRHMATGNINQMVVRHSEFKDDPTNGNGPIVNFPRNAIGALAFNLYVHDNGAHDPDLASERDVYAFVGVSQKGFWILDSRCDENAGDCVILTNNNTTEDVYIGRLVAHSEGENCIDIKDFNRVVVSESDCWDLRRVIYGNSGGNSQNFYVNDEGVQQNYVYFLNNRSWDTGGSNFATSNIGGRVYFIGNISFASPAGTGFSSGGGGGSRHVYFNTFVGSETGIYHYGSGGSQDRYMVGNLIDGASLYQTRLQSSTSVINRLDYNYYSDVGDFASGGGSAVIHNGLAEFTAALGFEQNGAEGISPGYFDGSVYDFRITAGSGARDVVPVGVVSTLPFLTDLFNDLSLTPKDRAGTLRPQDSAWDIGAYEFSTIGQGLIFEDSFETPDP